MKSKARVETQASVVGQGIVHHSMGEASLAIIGQKDITEVETDITLH